MKRIVQIALAAAILYALWTGCRTLETMVLAKGHQMEEEQ